MKQDYRVYLGSKRKYKVSKQLSRELEVKPDGAIMSTVIFRKWLRWQAGPILIWGNKDDSVEDILYNLMHENLHIALEGIDECKASKALDLTDEVGTYINQHLWGSFGQMLMMRINLPEAKA
jgi:hypothetical protein